MAYVSLYRKYRPQSFAEVVGQRHVTRTLANAVAEDRLHHAYLLTGPRGTGKTSTARILAKAINCQAGPTAEPCQTCELCVAITDGSSVDVIELDMASHGGVDDARELRERALFAPAAGRRKVYILDEVHMASPQAFNALLKLIEEPPGHVLFAMATTDPQKVLPTILSRVQRLDLRRVAAREMADHVRRIAALEGFTVDDGAVEAVVRAGEGSVRDTLSVLDQVRSYSGGEVTAERVAEVLGHTPADRLFEVVTLLAARDLAGLFALVQGLLDGGADLRRFTLDLVAHLRDLLVVQVAPDRRDLVDATADHHARLTAQADALPRERMIAAIDLLADTLSQARRGPARLPLELALARIAGAGTGTTEVSPAGAPREAVASPAGAPRQAVAPAPAPTSRHDGGDARPEAGGGPPEAGDAELSELVAAWATVVDVLKAQSARLGALARGGVPVGLDGDTLIVGFAHGFHATELAKPEHLDPVIDALERIIGRRLAVRTSVTGDQTPSSTQPAAVAREETDVREAEAAGDEPDPDAAARAVSLLRAELGAEPVDGS